MGSQGARCVFLAVYYIFFLQKILLSSATLKLWLILSGVFFSLSRKYTYNRTYTTICIHAERTLIIIKFIN